MEPFETARLERYFRHVTDQVAMPAASARSLVITHMLADRPPFVRAVDRVAGVAAVLPKPKSVHPGAARTVGLVPGQPAHPRTLHRSDLALGYMGSVPPGHRWSSWTWAAVCTGAAAAV